MTDAVHLSGSETSHRVPKALTAESDRLRKDIIDALAGAEELMGTVQQWTTGEISTGEGIANIVATIYKHSDNSILGIAKINGNIIGHAKLAGAAPLAAGLAVSVAALAAYAMIVDITNRLNRIESKVDRILQALADDRRASLYGAIKAVGDALQVLNQDTSRGLMHSIAPHLRSSIEAETVALRRLMELVPEPTNQVRIKGYSLFDGTDQTRKTLVQCEDAFLAIFEGIRALAQLYTALGEPKLAWSLTDRLLADLETLDLRDLHRKARYVPPQANGAWPELFWTNAMDAITAGRRQAEEYIAHGEPVLEIELTPEEARQLVARAAEYAKLPPKVVA